MNKIYIVFCALVLLLAKVNAQQITVLDESNNQPLAGAEIGLPSRGELLFTDHKGQVILPELLPGDSVILRSPGFETTVLTYSDLGDQNFRVILAEKSFSLDQVVMSASKFEEKQEDVAQQIQVITSKDITFMNQQTSADVMQQSGNVFVQKSQMGGGSTIIRGFETNKVLMVVDGVRMNNAIYRGGHLQNIITLDNNMLDRTEIVFGPGSVVYGSDALGGVIHFYTKKPVLAYEEGKPNVRVNAFTRYSTASREKTGHLDFNLGFKKLAFMTSVTVSDFDDLRAGHVRNPFYGDWGKRTFYVDQVNGVDSMFTNKDVNLQVGSGYSQLDFMEKILFRHNENLTSLLNFQYSTSSDIPRYDRLSQMTGSDPRYAEWYYGPQKRLLASYTLSVDAPKKLHDHARFIAAWQDVEESRNTRRFQKTELSHRTEHLGIFSMNADLDKKIGKHELRYGIEGVFNQVESTAYAEDIETDSTYAIDTRYPDGGSTMRSIAAYVTHTIELNKKLILNEGIRFSNVGLTANFVDTTFFPFPFTSVKQNNSAVNGNLGLIFMPGKGWRTSLLASSGFRAPNVDDLSKVFESVPGNVIVPNPGLKPEYTYNLDLDLSRSFGEEITVAATGFYTIYKDAITTQPGTFNGSDSILFDGSLSQVTMNVNANDAYLYGLNGRMYAKLSPSFFIQSTVNYTYGRIRTDTTDYPLDHIPPIYGKTSLILKKKKFQGEFYVMYNGWKRKKDYNIFGEDNFGNATPYGMPAWYTLNVRTMYTITRNFKVQLALENILDQNYRVFASGINAPGRNLIVTLRGNF